MCFFFYSRYCFVEMPVNTNLENVQKKILEIPFHGNKMKADRCFGNTRLLGVSIHFNEKKISNQ